MELNLHPIATKCFASGREFQENDRVASYLLREETMSPATGSTGSPQGEPKRAEIVRRDLLESEDSTPPGGFVYCRWVTVFKPRREDDSAKMLKLTAENLFLTLAIPAGSESLSSQPSAINTPLLQFLALMLERKRLIKLRGLTEDGLRQIYEHMPSHQLYEVPVGDLNVEFFQKIQEHLGVLVGEPKVKSEATVQPSAVSS
jgi:hypothetical protein